MLSNVKTRMFWTVSNINYYLTRYIEEVIQSCIAVSIIKILANTSNKEVDVFKIIQYSILLGSITFILEEYDHKYAENVKTGIKVATGTTLLKSF